MLPVILRLDAKKVRQCNMFLRFLELLHAAEVIEMDNTEHHVILVVIYVDSVDKANRVADLAFRYGFVERFVRIS